MFCSFDAWSLEITFFLPFLLLEMSRVQFSCMLTAVTFCFLPGIAISLMHPECVWVGLVQTPSRCCLEAAVVLSSPVLSEQEQVLHRASSAVCLFSPAATYTLRFHTPASLASLVSICCSSAEMLSCWIPFLTFSPGLLN